MPTTVTMTRPMRSEDGLSTLLAGQQYTVGDAYAAYLIRTAQAATDTFGANPFGPLQTQIVAAQVAALQPSAFVGTWRGFPGVTMRLRMNGTGTVTMDARNAAGVITTAVYTASVAGATLVDYAYPGDDADSIRITLTGTATAEVI